MKIAFKDGSELYNIALEGNVFKHNSSFAGVIVEIINNGSTGID